MALKKSEKNLIGIALIAGGIAIMIGAGLPQWDAFIANGAKVGSLNDEIKSLASQKESLSAQIAVLEKNTDIPAGIEIKTYKPNAKEQAIKDMLDQLVAMATETGNRLIRLTPSEEVVAPAAKAGEKNAVANGNPSAAANVSSGQKDNAPPAPQLDSFGYDLVVRGTYDTVQAFLKQSASRKALMEIGDLVLEDDAAGGKNQSGERITDPSAPIRLTAKVRLVLQPVN